MDYSIEDIFYPGIVLCSLIMAGCLKRVLIWKSRETSGKNLGGLGGFPSTHNAITSSIMFTTLFSAGPNDIEFLIAFGFFIVVCIDSLDLRNKLGLHAKLTNEIAAELNLTTRARERIGHKITEVIGGVIVGLISCFLFLYIIPLLMR